MVCFGKKAKHKKSKIPNADADAFGIFENITQFRYHILIIRAADTIYLFTFHYYFLLPINRPFKFSED